jgi:ribosome-binding factor A
MSPDLQLARVYYTMLGDLKAREETAKALTRATPFVRRQIAGRLRLRRVPEFEFRFDQSIEQQDRIEQILNELHAQDAERAALNAESEQTTDAARRSEPDEHDSD